MILEHTQSCQQAICRTNSYLELLLIANEFFDYKVLIRLNWREDFPGNVS